MMTTIRQLAVSRGGNIVAAAEFKHVVHLYDLRDYQHIRTLETTLDFGGRRLAISEDGKTVVAGAYQVHGIAAYSGNDGSQLWRRKDLKKVQEITFRTDGSQVMCCFDRASCESLNITTGKSGQTLRGVRGAWESPFAPVRLLERSSDYALADFEAPIVDIPKASFAILCAAFNKERLCISEAGGPVRCFDAATGREIWRFTPQNGAHFLRIDFCHQLESFVGICWSFKKGGEHLLQRFASTDGTPEPIASVGSASASEFCLNGSQLLTNSGAVFDVASGKVAGKMQFPLATLDADAP